MRGHPGQIEAARIMRKLMSGSEIRESHRDGDTRVQDPYCIRCQPQVVGACLDLLSMAARTLQIEANAATDNPLVLIEAGRIVSGGNFHAEPVAFAADQIALAISEIGAIAQRRIALMVDPTLSCDLPPFLAKDPGLNSGLMIAEVTTAALMSENKHLANPCSTDSTPTSANQEDHVSMAAHWARRLSRMNDNLANILGVELLCAAMGVEHRAPLQTSKCLQKILSRLREDIAALETDRYMAPDLKAAAQLVSNRTLLDAISQEYLISLEALNAAPLTSQKAQARSFWPSRMSVPTCRMTFWQSSTTMARFWLTPTGSSIASIQVCLTEPRRFAPISTAMSSTPTVRQAMNPFIRAKTHHRPLLEHRLRWQPDLQGRHGTRRGRNRRSTPSAWHKPYHDALATQIERVKAIHGLCNPL